MGYSLANARKMVGSGNPTWGWGLEPGPAVKFTITNTAEREQTRNEGKPDERKETVLVLSGEILEVEGCGDGAAKGAGGIAVLGDDNKPVKDRIKGMQEPMNRRQTPEIGQAVDFWLGRDELRALVAAAEKAGRDELEDGATVTLAFTGERPYQTRDGKERLGKVFEAAYEPPRSKTKLASFRQQPADEELDDLAS
jgi:hypothetical protein